LAEKNFASLFSGPPPAADFLLPPVFLARISSNFGAATAEVLVAGLAARQGKGLQRKAIAALENEVAQHVFDTASLAERGCQQSGKHPRANYWLAPPPRAFEMCHLAPNEFVVSVRLRFGLATLNSSSFCNRCHDRIMDDSGKHELACMCGPERIGLHNGLETVAFNYATRGGMQPTHQPRPFAADQGARLDLGFLRANAHQVLDFAVTSHLRDSAVVAAATSSGGAATAYEQVKRARYGGLVRPGQVLHPVVFDTLGAWGEAAVEPLGFIAVAFARQCNLGPSAVHLFYANLNATIIRGVARLLMATSATVQIVAREAGGFQQSNDGFQRFTLLKGQF
jgi:hypothetical protein